MQPRTVGAFTDISRKLLLQSSIDVEAFVREDLATVLVLVLLPPLAGVLGGTSTAPRISSPIGRSSATRANTGRLHHFISASGRYSGSSAPSLWVMR